MPSADIVPMIAQIGRNAKLPQDAGRVSKWGVFRTSGQLKSGVGLQKLDDIQDLDDIYGYFIQV